MKILILEKWVTPSHTLKKGQIVDMRSADAKTLVDAGKAEYTAESKKQMVASKKILDARAKAGKEAVASADAETKKQLEDSLATVAILQKELDILKAEKVK